jgi:hypothetical protein
VPIQFLVRCSAIGQRYGVTFTRARRAVRRCVIVLAGGRVAADGPPDEALRPAIIDAAHGVGFRIVIFEAVTQPVAWLRRP